MDPYELEPGQHQFEQVDADAVCAQCSTVNNEGTLLCKGCGNNLRDQRAQRIAQAQGGDYITPKKSPVHLLTGLLVVLGILTIFYVIGNLQNFEDMMLDSISSQQEAADQDLWDGTYAPMYDEMLTLIEENPTSANLRRITLNSPVTETTYSGRYLVASISTEDNAQTIVGEAQLQRIGERVHFVFLSDRGAREARGYSNLEIDAETGEVSSPRIQDTAEIYLDDKIHIASGGAISIPSGGHNCFVTHTGASRQYEYIAYRVRR